MFFLFGEQVSVKSLDEGQFDCPVCNDTRQYSRLAEVNYFTFFLIPIAPLSRLADYCQCTACGCRFNLDEEHKDTVRALWQHLTAADIDDSHIVLEIAGINKSREDIFSFMQAEAYHLNFQGKEKIIEAAFLMTHACCEIEHQDRLRVNLIGNALGAPLEFVEAIVNRIRASNYYGIKRFLVVS